MPLIEELSSCWKCNQQYQPGLWWMFKHDLRCWSLWTAIHNLMVIWLFEERYTTKA